MSDVRRPRSPGESTASTGDVASQDSGLRVPDVRPTTSDIEAGFLYLQLADSAFPTGGFAHSAGLEAAWQLGEVRGQDALAAWLADALAQHGEAVLPFAAAAHDGVLPYADIDRRCDATITNHIANRASRALGHGLLAAAVAAFPVPAVAELRTTVRAARLPGHLAPLGGAVGAALGLSRDATLRLLLFQHLRGLVSSAVRLAIIGPLAGQRLQHRMAGNAAAVLVASAGRGIDDVATSAPLHDLCHGHHDRLYSRLFSS